MDPDMGNKLIGMYPDDLEEVEEKPRPRKKTAKKEEGENILTQKNVDLQGMAEKAEKESEEE